MSELSIIIAIFALATTIIGIIISMLIWVINESNELRKEAQADRKDLLQLTKNIENEMKDFHYRLLDIERGRM